MLVQQPKSILRRNKEDAREYEKQMRLLKRELKIFYKYVSEFKKQIQPYYQKYKDEFLLDGINL